MRLPPTQGLLLHRALRTATAAAGTSGGRRATPQRNAAAHPSCSTFPPSSPVRALRSLPLATPWLRLLRRYGGLLRPDAAVFSDWVLLVGERRYPVHRVLLAHASEFFRNLFLGCRARPPVRVPLPRAPPPTATGPHTRARAEGCGDSQALAKGGGGGGRPRCRAYAHRPWANQDESCSRLDMDEGLEELFPEARPAAQSASWPARRALLNAKGCPWARYRCGEST